MPVLCRPTLALALAFALVLALALALVLALARARARAFNCALAPEQRADSVLGRLRDGARRLRVVRLLLGGAAGVRLRRDDRRRQERVHADRRRRPAPRADLRRQREKVRMRAAPGQPRRHGRGRVVRRRPRTPRHPY